MARKIWVLLNSTVRCAVCNGWGGEWGISQGVGPMCVDCWRKNGKL